MDGPAGPPRDNGELLFGAPWEARVFAMAVALIERQSLPWDEFRLRLVDAIATEPDRPYYESWAAALESLIVDLGFATRSSISLMTTTPKRT